LGIVNLGEAGLKVRRGRRYIRLRLSCSPPSRSSFTLVSFRRADCFSGLFTLTLLPTALNSTRGRLRALQRLDSSPSLAMSSSLKGKGLTPDEEYGAEDDFEPYFRRLHHSSTSSRPSSVSSASRPTSPGLLGHLGLSAPSLEVSTVVLLLLRAGGDS